MSHRPAGVKWCDTVSRLVKRCAVASHFAPVTDPESQPLGEKLRRALIEAGLSIRQFARLLAEQNGTSAEHERRKLSRYLAGENAPSHETAALMATALGKPADYFATALPERVELGARLRDLGEIIGELRLTIEEKGGDAAVVAELRRLGRRLEALEGEVETHGKATAKALKGVAQRLGRVEVALGKLEPEQAPTARGASRVRTAAS